MTTINFNWNTAKMVNGKQYNFTFTTIGGTSAEMVCIKDGSNFAVVENGDTHEREIFRNGATVADMISLCLCKAGKVESGIYKAFILAVFNEDYTTANRYGAGVAYPSSEAGHNTPNAGGAYFYGFELEVSARTRECYRALSAIESNIVRKVSDSSIDSINGAGGIEFVSGALIAPKDAINPDFYAPMCDILTGLAKSKTMSGNGLHFHISREAFGETEAEQMENIAKVIYIENYILNGNALTAVFGRPVNDWARANRTETGLVNHVAEVAKVAGRAFMNDAEMRRAITKDLTPFNKIRCGHNYPNERYQRINITNPKTIEFRQGKGDISSKSLARIAQHIETLVKYAKTTKWGALSEAGYLRSIPASNKYQILRDCWQIED